MDLGVGSFGAGELPHAHRHRLERSSGRPVHLICAFIYVFGCFGVSCMWDLIPDQGWNPGPLQWGHGVLATGQPGKPKRCFFFSGKF